MMPKYQLNPSSTGKERSKELVGSWSKAPHKARVVAILKPKYQLKQGLHLVI